MFLVNKMSITDISQLCCVSKQSVRRYINQFTGSGEV